MKPRQPTPADFKAYRRLFDASGRDKKEFDRRLAAALKGKSRQRRRRTASEFQLLALEMLCRTLERQGATRTQAIRQLVRDMKIGGRGGTEDSLVKRLREELRKPEFRHRAKQRIATVRYQRGI